MSRPVRVRLAAATLVLALAPLRAPAHAQEPATGPGAAIAPAPVGSRFT